MTDECTKCEEWTLQDAEHWAGQKIYAVCSWCVLVAVILGGPVLMWMMETWAHFQREGTLTFEDVPTTKLSLIAACAIAFCIARAARLNYDKEKSEKSCPEHREELKLTIVDKIAGAVVTVLIFIAGMFVLSHFSARYQ